MGDPSGDVDERSALDSPPHNANGDKWPTCRSESAADRIPDLILTGHVHDYQRFNGNINGKAVTTIVAGAGGYNHKLHTLDRHLFDPEGVPYKFDDGPETLEKFNDFQHGYLIIDVREDKILGSYIAVDDPAPGSPVPTRRAKPYDEFQIALKLQ